MFRGDLVMGIACTALQKDGDPRVDNSIGTLGHMVGSPFREGYLGLSCLANHTHSHHNKKPIFRLLTLSIQY
jgi:hypothetical protein